MGIVELLGLAGSVSLIAGWRLYFTVFVTGLAMRLEWISLPEHLRILDALADPWVLGIAALGAIAEFFADKVMWLDSIWDTLHTAIRPLGGALLTLAIVDASDPVWQVVVFLLGGGAALMSHGAKAGARALVNSSPEPVSNAVVSTGEGCCHRQPAVSRFCQSGRRADHRSRPADSVPLSGAQEIQALATDGRGRELKNKPGRAGHDAVCDKGENGRGDRI